MRIAILYNILRQKSDEEIDFDRATTISSLTKALELSHEVVGIECTRDLQSWLGDLLQFSPDLIFNFAAGFPSAARESFFPALYEQLGIPYFGSDPTTMLLCHNKGLTNKIVAQAGVNVPRSIAVAALDELAMFELLDLRFPIIVKPNSEAWGLGLDSSSVVRDSGALATRVDALLNRFHGIVLCQEFVPRGEDVSMSFVQGLGEEVFGPVIYDYDRANDVFSYEVKSKQYDESILKFSGSIEAAIQKRLIDDMTKATIALDLRGYGRADFRITPGGDCYFIEMNARTEVMPERSDFFAPLRRAGYSYEQVVLHMVEYASANACRKNGLAGLRDKALIEKMMRNTSSVLVDRWR